MAPQLKQQESSSPRPCETDTSWSSVSVSVLKSSNSDQAADSLFDSSVADQTRLQQQRPVPVPGEPSLYQIPKNLFVEYRAIPTVANLGIWGTSLCLAALSTFEKLQWAWIRSLVALQKPVPHWPWSKIAQFLLKAIVLTLSLRMVVLETFLPPSRISTPQLVQKYFLPSKFSRYEAIPSTANDATHVQGVHYLICQTQRKEQDTESPPRGVIHLNHGFGASSLSWLPVLEPMANQLGYECVLAHDAPGFGFTDRPHKWLESYTPKASAAIGNGLLQQQCVPWTPSDQNMDDADLADSSKATERILLMGHSMGSIATLHMALDPNIPDHVEKRVVLVDPALGLRPGTKASQKAKRRRAVTNALSTVLYPPVSFLLRQVVGKPGFWRSGLKVAWGDPKRLSITDVLRFQWPGISKGWEKGLLSFTRAQSLPTELTDQELLEKVLALPNTRVDVIYGGSDKIVRPSMIQNFFEPYKNNVKLVELEGLGHDPFEEDVEAFMSALKNVLSES